jgi:hypothetical protein
MVQEKKITLPDTFLTKHEGPKEASKEVLVGKQIAIPNDTLDEESKVESEEEPTKALEEKSKEGHRRKKKLRNHILKSQRKKN